MRRAAAFIWEAAGRRFYIEDGQVVPARRDSEGQETAFTGVKREDGQLCGERTHTLAAFCF